MKFGRIRPNLVELAPNWNLVVFY